MRNRFEHQLLIGQRPIEQTPISPKCKDALEELLAALKAIYCNKEYNEKIFCALEKSISKNKNKTGRKGMDLWQIFVMAQVRLCLGASYDRLHNLANNHFALRFLMGVECEYGFKRIQFEYQNIYDNVSLLSDDLIGELNAIILEFGHKEVFKKKETTALHLKTDSFVVESNVHFPTDYNLLWDCVRKCLDTVLGFLDKYDHIEGWRKIANWRQEAKGLMRELGKACGSGGKNKEKRIKEASVKYLAKTRALMAKLTKSVPTLPINDFGDLAAHYVLEHFMALMDKHIDLLHRRLINGETIPHCEKMFSVFEEYTQMVKKGKLHPNVELGKKLAITTDQFNLIIHYQIMEDEQDRDIVINLADRILARHKVSSWSFDKGFWLKANKALLQLEVPTIVMPKLGKRNEQETQEEHSPVFKRLKNKHCAIESNINELENRGLDRCPDRGYHRYKNYIGLGVCAYNLKKIGKALLDQQRTKVKEERSLHRAA
jgi:transposase, IS5 family